MFSWARKQRLFQRNSLDKSQKSVPPTNLHSISSSPQSFNKSLSTLNSEGRNPFSTPKKYQQRPAAPFAQIGVFTMPKSDLMAIIATKNKPQGSNLQCQNAKEKVSKTIKIKIEVNRLLDEYCRAVKEILACHIWGLFGVALVLFKLGFIRDLVDDRKTTRQVWEILHHPDELSLYIFLEQILCNRVNLEKAIVSIQGHLNTKIDGLSKANAILTMSTRKCETLNQLLRVNRLARVKMRSGPVC